MVTGSTGFVYVRKARSRREGATTVDGQNPALLIIRNIP